ncbi:4'-phosphopantetheinyl transferase family protein [Pseudoduganella violacea]|uniref:4'-phosphopantetheinyl transferase n=1 Tax=Pseudoduganella violacea TaxID=1715466 RepID=A0A7W5FTH9_9BURK|nr:4'-phosphopantetheinyl transferase superfamily protein [Pseudoduganella violacea]MBB3118895.1 4'-phosphopantetheinyl transferase [Pseudoduganella violacea]
MAAAAQAVVWLLDAAGLAAADPGPWLARLGASERQRYQRFIREERRRQFLLGRMLLRQAASALLGLPQDVFTVEERIGQAPVLQRASGGAAPYFSLSHSGSWIACAISRDTPLGLDVERIDPARDLAALARQAFGAQESAEILALPEPRRSAAFFSLWSQREAEYKLGQTASASRCYFLPHPQLSIAVCAAAPLAPALRIIDALD